MDTRGQVEDTLELGLNVVYNDRIVKSARYLATIPKIVMLKKVTNHQNIDISLLLT